MILRGTSQTTLLRRQALTLLAAATLCASTSISPAVAQDFSGPVLLTVTGNVQTPTRPGYDELNDKFFGFNEVEFETAAQFDYEKLRTLTNVTVKADFPKGGDVHTYEGPLLKDVLAAAGASGKTITVQALDGYAAIVPIEEMIDKGAVVALQRDGVPFAIGDYGPTQIVFPRAERADLADMPDDNWVWSIFHINVE
ncbi:MAG: molybdopterin-dependent oxidoreductase [Pseudomonadota bacterium]